MLTKEPRPLKRAPLREANSQSRCARQGSRFLSQHMSIPKLTLHCFILISYELMVQTLLTDCASPSIANPDDISPIELSHVTRICHRDSDFSSENSF